MRDKEMAMEDGNWLYIPGLDFLPFIFLDSLMIRLIGSLNLFLTKEEIMLGLEEKKNMLRHSVPCIQDTRRCMVSRWRQYYYQRIFPRSLAVCLVDDLTQE